MRSHRTTHDLFDDLMLDADFDSVDGLLTCPIIGLFDEPPARRKPRRRPAPQQERVH